MSISRKETKIAVVVLNHNNWKDTISCVESLLAGGLRPHWMFIIDNASCNDSFVQLTYWAKRSVASEQLVIAESVEIMTLAPAPPAESVLLIKNFENKGYAAGNNIGLSLGLQWGAHAFWILNNDTVVSPNALGAMKKHLFSKQRPGLCGSLICCMDTPQKVQCRAGGWTNKWTGLSELDGAELDIETALEDADIQVEARLNFIHGASVMASRQFVETVGLLDERYFLYSEEQDWAYSAKGRFDLAYAPDAIVYHKGGASTGFSSDKSALISFWHLTRSRLLLTWKHVPEALPTVCLAISWAAGRMLWRRCLKPMWQNAKKLK